MGGRAGGCTGGAAPLPPYLPDPACAPLPSDLTLPVLWFWLAEGETCRLSGLCTPCFVHSWPMAMAASRAYCGIVIVFVHQLDGGWLAAHTHCPPPPPPTLRPQAFSTPKKHHKSKPFFDHVLSFTLADGRIWFRNYQASAASGARVLLGARCCAPAPRSSPAPPYRAKLRCDAPPRCPQSSKPTAANVDMWAFAAAVVERRGGWVGSRVHLPPSPNGGHILLAWRGVAWPAAAGRRADGQEAAGPCLGVAGRSRAALLHVPHQGAGRAGGRTRCLCRGARASAGM